jgi:hypothetical protein
MLEIKFVSTSGQVLLKQTESVFPESGTISLSTDKLQRGLVLVMITDLNTHLKQSFKILVR